MSRAWSICFHFTPFSLSSQQAPGRRFSGSSQCLLGVCSFLVTHCLPESKTSALDMYLSLCLFDTNPSLPGTSAYFLHSLILLGSLPKFTPLLTFPPNDQVLDILACSIPKLLVLSFMLLASGLCILILILILILVYVS